MMPESNNGVAMKTKSVPLLPPDHPHATRSRPLGERQGNLQSPTCSPTKKPHGGNVGDRDTKQKNGSKGVTKSKSSTNLSAVFGKLNRSNKDLTAPVQERDKENTTPPSTSSGATETPIWAQFATIPKPESTHNITNARLSDEIEAEITKYTPKEYSPSKQRNFEDAFEKPALRPTLNSRPQSAYVLATEGFAGVIGRRISGSRPSIEGRNSEDSGRRMSKDGGRRDSVDRAGLIKRSHAERKTSSSSAEQTSTETRLNVVKRGGRVMAAVAALQGKGKKDEPTHRQEIELDPKAVDEAFEAVLDSRNIPEPMRQKMRSLTLRVKADFVRQDQGSRTAASSPEGSMTANTVNATTAPEASTDSPIDAQMEADYQKSAKRSRPRSRTFTLSKGEKHSSAPTKKHRSQSKNRPTSIHIPSDAPGTAPTDPMTPTSPFGSLGRKSAAPALPADYLSYLRKHVDPTVVEVGRLHKLRILLRNETVAWVDSFLSQGGMAEIVQLLHRIMRLEWREEHEDQLLHETLLCLKGLCTTERAMTELALIADDLFPALLGMLFDDEKKGPAEYVTRTIIINVLFTFLVSATNSSASVLEERSMRILSYLGEPPKSEDERPVEFVLGMHTPRPYRLWCREVTNVSKEVFWIFLHNLNVVPLPKKPSDAEDENFANAERTNVLETSYTDRHFPGSHPPVPAAPYIGGVEWDATTYLTAHLDLLNGLVASLPSTSARNSLRAELKASGFEKTMGGTLRTCKEKFYSGVHDGLRAWVAAAVEDGWDTRFVREGPDPEERARSVSPKKASPMKKKKAEEAPRLEEVKVEALPKLDLEIGKVVELDGNDDGWLV